MDPSLALDESQRRSLREFEALLREHAPPLGLVASADLPRLFERHILDSLRAAGALVREEVCDLGSGAGLPGIPLAIARPECRVSLCEPRRRRVAFLELALERLEIPNAVVAPVRAQELPPESADACTARAFAPLEASWEVARRLLRPGGRLLYFAGEGLKDPEGAAKAVTVPEAPARVEAIRLLENQPPVVIMTRR